MGQNGLEERIGLKTNQTTESKCNSIQCSFGSATIRALAKKKAQIGSADIQPAANLSVIERRCYQKEIGPRVSQVAPKKSAPEVQNKTPYLLSAI